MDRAMLEHKYLVEHKTLEEIGQELGVSRQAVFYYTRKYRIPAHKAENVDSTCDICGKNFTVTRKRWKKTLKHFCSFACYKVYLRNDEYRQRRTGQRIGRDVMEKKIARKLRDGEVVHHIDGNNDNNDPKNLILFSSHSDHLKHHHELRRDKIESIQPEMGK